MGILVPIEGGRAIAARDVLAQFAADTEALSTESIDVAGYAIVLWDDQGSRSICVHQGKRCPMASTLVPDFVQQAVKDFQVADMS
jgi:hypothetical protein